MREGILNDEGWCATDPIDGPKYRRSRICPPSADTKYMSITTVYMNSKEEYGSTISIRMEKSTVWCRSTQLPSSGACKAGKGLDGRALEQEHITIHR